MPHYDRPTKRQQHSDPGLEAVLSQIDERQAASDDIVGGMDPERLLFGLMRLIPRDRWNTPWPQVDPEIYRRGVQSPEFAMTYPFNMWSPGLRKLTPAQTILRLSGMPPVEVDSRDRLR